MEDYPTFELKVGGRSVELAIGRCAVTFIRQELHKSFISAELDDQPDGDQLHVFLNYDACTWLAGYDPKVNSESVSRPTVRQTMEDDAGYTFRELHGWNPNVYEFELPDESVDKAYNELVLKQLEDQFGEVE